MEFSALYPLLDLHHKVTFKYPYGQPVSHYTKFVDLGIQNESFMNSYSILVQHVLTEWYFHIPQLLFNIVKNALDKQYYIPSVLLTLVLHVLNLTIIVLPVILFHQITGGILIEMVELWLRPHHWQSFLPSAAISADLGKP